MQIFVKPLPERPSPSTLNQPTPSKTSRPRSKTRRESLPTSRDSSLLANYLRTAEPSLTITYKRNPPFTSSLVSEVKCRSSSRPLPERPSPSTFNQPTPSKTSRPRSKTRRESLPTSRDSSLLASSLRTGELSLTTTSRRNPSLRSHTKANADLRQDPNQKDHHPLFLFNPYHRLCKGQDP
jgi:hypothetical protein